MTEYQTERGKLVAQHGVSIAVHEDDGSVQIRIGDQTMHLPEDKAATLYGLLGDVCSYVPLTERRSEQLAQRSEDEPE